MNYENQVNEILDAHGLNFAINKHPLQATDGSGNNMITPYFGLFNSKSGECLNTCKAGYSVSQNSEIVEMILKGMAKFGSKLKVSKAGAINGGRKVYFQMEIEGMSKVGGDYIKRYITAIDSNDGSTGLSIGIGDFDMWCENQFFKFYKAGEAKFRHTATIEQKIQSIPFLIETALDKSLKQVEIYKKWLSTPLTLHLADKMVKEVLGYDRVITSVEDRAKLGKRSVEMMDTLYADIKTETDHSGNNLWSLFAGVTRYTTHHQIAPKRDNGHIEGLIGGEAYKKGMAAFEFCMAQ